MMFASHLPLHHWVDAFSAAAFIGNHLPVLSRDKKSPVELLQQQKPDYSHLRVLSTSYHPYLRLVSDHKLELRSLMWVLILGYSTHYKGYRCIYPPTEKVYVSRHVVFDKECFPFKGQYKHLVPHYTTNFLKAWQQDTTSEVPVTDHRLSRPLPPPISEVQPTALHLRFLLHHHQPHHCHR